MINREDHTEGLPEATVLLAYIKGTASAEEQQLVETWMAEEQENEAELCRIARICYAVQTHERIQARDPVAAFEAVRERIEWKRRKLWLRRAAAVAACLAGVVLLSALFSYRKGDFSAGEPQWMIVRTNPGMRSQMTLPDGTTVHLNSGSVLSYPVPYDSGERRVNLVGEAFFDVEPNENQPFVVSVSDNKLRVHVTGTSFNLQAYESDNEVQAILVNGSVNLELPDENGKLHRRRLRPSERALCNLSTGEIGIETVNPLHYIAWIEGKLVFKDTPVPEVLKRLSHFYNVQFEIKDPVIETYRFTGTFQNRQLSQVLDYIKISSRIDYTINQSIEDDSNGSKHTIITLRKRQ